MDHEYFLLYDWNPFVNAFFFFLHLCLLKIMFKLMQRGTSLVVQWLRVCLYNAGDTGLIPGLKTKMPPAAEQLSGNLRVHATKGPT